MSKFTFLIVLMAVVAIVVARPYGVTIVDNNPDSGSQVTVVDSEHPGSSGSQVNVVDSDSQVNVVDSDGQVNIVN